MRNVEFFRGCCNTGVITKQNDIGKRPEFFPASNCVPLYDVALPFEGFGNRKNRQLLLCELSGGTLRERLRVQGDVPFCPLGRVD